MKYSLFKYKSEEAIKDGGNLKRFEFSIDFGTWKKERLSKQLCKIYWPDGLLNTELLINEVSKFG